MTTVPCNCNKTLCLKSRCGFKLSDSTEPPQSVRFRRERTDLAMRFLKDAEQTFWILEVVVEDVQTAYEAGLFSRNKDGGTWNYLVPSTQPLGSLIQLYNYKTALSVNLGEIAPAGEASMWKFFMTEGKVEAVLKENMVVKKSAQSLQCQLFVTDVHRLVLMDFVMAKGSKTQCLSFNRGRRPCVRVLAAFAS